MAPITQRSLPLSSEWHSRVSHLAYALNPITFCYLFTCSPCFTHTDLFAIPGTQTARSCLRNRDSAAPLAQSTLRHLGSCQAPSVSLDPDSTVVFLGQASLMTLFNMILLRTSLGAQWLGLYVPIQGVPANSWSGI